MKEQQSLATIYGEMMDNLVTIKDCLALIRLWLFRILICRFRPSLYTGISIVPGISMGGDLSRNLVTYSLHPSLVNPINH
jgi:hypothetical protein